MNIKLKKGFNQLRVKKYSTYKNVINEKKAKTIET